MQRTKRSDYTSSSLQKVKNNGKIIIKLSAIALEFSSLTMIREKSVSFSKEQHVASRYLKLNMELLKKKF